MNSNKTEDLILSLIRKFHPIAPKDLMIATNNQENLSFAEIQRTIWCLIDKNKIEFTNDRKLQLANR